MADHSMALKAKTLYKNGGASKTPAKVVKVTVKKPAMKVNPLKKAK